LKSLATTNLQARSLQICVRFTIEMIKKCVIIIFIKRGVMVMADLKEKIKTLKNALGAVPAQFVLDPSFEEQINAAELAKLQKMQEINKENEIIAAELKAFDARFGVEESVVITPPYNIRDDDTVIETTRTIDGVMFYHYHTGLSSANDMLQTGIIRLDQKQIKKGLKLEQDLAEKKAKDKPSFLEKLRIKGMEESLMIMKAEGNDFGKYKKLIALQEKVKSYQAERKQFEAHLKSHSNLTRLNQELEDLETTLEVKERNQEQGAELLQSRVINKQAMMLVKFVQENTDELSVQQRGALGHLRTELSGVPNVNNILQNFLHFSNTAKVASALHEDWRQTRKLPDGTFDPRWKAVKDASFEAQYATTSDLPSNIRKNEGKLELDIANTKFEDLSYNWQQENFEAAVIASDLAKKSYSEYDIGIVGHIIHEAWLKRNEWAIGGELGVPFAELPKHEQDKDLRQYEIAKETLSKAKTKVSDSQFGS